MAVPPVAHQVDHDVLPKPLAEGEGEPGHPHAGLGIVPVHVQDRSLDHLRDVGGVHAGPSGRRRGGEPELIVDHHVDGPPGGEAGKGTHAERLGHHALAGERGVAMQEEGEHLGTVLVERRVLPGPGHPFDHRVDGLEVARVGRQLDGDGRPVPPGELAGRSDVVLHVPRALDGLRIDVTLELPEHPGVALPDDVHQHVQPAAVGHPHDHVLDPGPAGVFQEEVEHGDQALRALQREPLVPHVLRVQETLEAFGGVQALEDVPLVVWVDLPRDPFHPFLDPALLVGLLDVHVLDADRPAVGVAEQAERVPERHHVAAGQPVHVELAVEVPDGQPVRRRVQVGVHGSGPPRGGKGPSARRAGRGSPGGGPGPGTC